MQIDSPDFMLKVPDMIHNIIPPNFLKPTLTLVPKVSHIFLTLVVKFGVNIPNTLGDINGNVAQKLENVVTTLNKAINNNKHNFLLVLLKRNTSLQFFHCG